MKRSSKSGWSVVYRVILLFVTGVFLLFLEALAFIFIGGTPQVQSSDPVSIEIPSGASVTEIGRILHEANIVAHPRAFEFAVRLLGADHRLQAGQVRMPPGLSIVEIIDCLTHFRAEGVRVVVREGLTAAQLAGLLQSAAGIDSSNFLKAVYDTAFAESLGFAGVSLEGYLFPDTYMLYQGMSPRRVAMRIALNFQHKVPDSIFSEGTRWNLDQHQIVTLASILQWEVLRREEWKLVSSVYHNRLRKKMLLQADPTVNYIMGQGPSRLKLRHLKIDSPYNTYLYKGLPPGPINNPGLRAIRAALQPARTDFLFFVASGGGYHTFSRTAEEHFEAKAQAKKARRQKASEDTTKHG